MITEVFSHPNYKDVLKAEIKANAKTRGYQTLLANAAQCQKAFLSQVLHSPVHLTPDHAANIAEFWKLDQVEEEYFLCLVTSERASSIRLKKVNQDRAEQLRTMNNEYFTRKMTPKVIKDTVSETLLFSRWYYSIVFISIQLGNIRDAESLSKKLQLPPIVIQEALQVLHNCGHIKPLGKFWETDKDCIKLEPNSPIAHFWRTMWRQEMISKMNAGKPFLFTKTTNFSIRKSDLEKVKSEAEAFYNRIIDLTNTPSNEHEAIFYIGIDLTQLL